MSFQRKPFKEWWFIEMIQALDLKTEWTIIDQFSKPFRFMLHLPKRSQRTLWIVNNGRRNHQPFGQDSKMCLRPPISASLNNIMLWQNKQVWQLKNPTCIYEFYELQPLQSVVWNMKIIPYTAGEVMNKIVIPQQIY